MRLGKRTLAVLLTLLAIFAMMPIQALATGKIITDNPVDLTICYTDETKAIPNARFDLYKVADVDEYARMTLTPAFEPYRYTVDGLDSLDDLTQESWLSLASTLKGYVQADKLTPAVPNGKTDENGILHFSVEPGLYLVIGFRATTDDYYTYSAVPFMVFLPGSNLADNDWDYEVTALPKFSKEYNPSDDPDDQVITRKVLKIWDDEGYESIRPEEITVQLLMDGEVFDTQILNKSNNWRYAWDNLDAKCEWTVVEKEIDKYAITIEQNGITFSITNKYVVPITGSSLPVQKKITGSSPASASTFTFTMSASDESCPMPEGTTGAVKEISIVGAGSAEFGEITFEYPGTYVYTISEKNSGTHGYTYDTTVYTVTFEVVQEDGELSYSRTIKDNGGNVCSAIEFTNSYKPPLPQTGVVWWPVPILLFAGCAFLMIGVIRRRRYE